MILPEVSVGSYITQLSLYAQESHISCHNMWISHYRVYSHYISAAEYKMQTEGLSAVVFFFFFPCESNLLVLLLRNEFPQRLDGGWVLA